MLKVVKKKQIENHVFGNQIMDGVKKEVEKYFGFKKKDLVLYKYILKETQRFFEVNNEIFSGFTDRKVRDRIQNKFGELKQKIKKSVEDPDPLKIFDEETSLHLYGELEDQSTEKAIEKLEEVRNL